MYVGTPFFDLNKLHKLKVNYEAVECNLKQTYDLLYSDADSFVYTSPCDDVYEWVRDHKTNFDNSDAQFNPDNTNKKIIR